MFVATFMVVSPVNYCGKSSFTGQLGANLVYFASPSYSVPHEESELMLGMHDVTSIATIHFT